MLLPIVRVNLANPMVGRGLARQRDTAIRMALGASRLRIVRQLMAESLTLAMGGVVCGLAIGVAVLSTAGTLMPTWASCCAAIAPDSRTSRSPRSASTARRSCSRWAWPWPPPCSSGSCRHGRRLGAISHRRSRWACPPRPGLTLRGSIARGLLVAGEMALALTSLVAAGLMLKSVVAAAGDGAGVPARFSRRASGLRCRAKTTMARAPRASSARRPNGSNSALTSQPRAGPTAHRCRGVATPRWPPFRIGRPWRAAANRPWASISSRPDTSTRSAFRCCAVVTLPRPIGATGRKR